MASLGEQFLKRNKVPYTVLEYDYRKKGAEVAAQAVGVPVSAAIKTLVVKASDGRFLFVLMPGGVSLSTRNLARGIGVKGVEMASEKDAERLTGYRVGGISPFGARTSLPVYMDLSVLDHDKVYINGGRRGLLVCVDPELVAQLLHADLIEAAC